jgi:hypothetical protein
VKKSAKTGSFSWIFNREVALLWLRRCNPSSVGIASSLWILRTIFNRAQRSKSRSLWTPVPISFVLLVWTCNLTIVGMAAWSGWCQSTTKWKQWTAVGPCLQRNMNYIALDPTFGSLTLLEPIFTLGELDFSGNLKIRMCALEWRERRKLINWESVLKNKDVCIIMKRKEKVN